MSRQKIESVVSRPSEYAAAVDVRGVGKGTRSLRDLFAPKVQSFTPLSTSCDVRSKEFFYF